MIAIYSNNIMQNKKRLQFKIKQKTNIKTNLINFTLYTDLK